MFNRVSCVAFFGEVAACMCKSQHFPPEELNEQPPPARRRIASSFSRSEKSSSAASSSAASSSASAISIGCAAAAACSSSASTRRIARSTCATSLLEAVLGIYLAPRAARMLSASETSSSAIERFIAGRCRLSRLAPTVHPLPRW